MSENQEHFRHILLFYYKKGKNVTQFAKKICSVYREDATTSSNWFHRFRDKNFDVKHAHHFGRFITENVEIFQKN